MAILYSKKKPPSKYELAAVSKARNYAFLLLRHRQRSEYELFQRLKKKKFSPAIIARTIRWLKDNDFIDDASFAKAWLESRLKKPLGIKRIRKELKAKGVPDQIIEGQFGKIKDKYSEEEMINQLIQRKLRTAKDADPAVTKRKIFSFLLRRGFSYDAVYGALDQWKK